MNPKTRSTEDHRAEAYALYEELRPQLELLEKIAEIAAALEKGKGDRAEHFEQLRSALDRVPAVFGEGSAEAVEYLHGAASALDRIDRGRVFIQAGGTAFLRWSYQLIGDAEAIPSEPTPLQLQERCWMVLDSYEEALNAKSDAVAAVYRSM